MSDKKINNFTETLADYFPQKTYALFVF